MPFRYAFNSLLFISSSLLPCALSFVLRPLDELESSTSWNQIYVLLAVLAQLVALVFVVGYCVYFRKKNRATDATRYESGIQMDDNVKIETTQVVAIPEVPGYVECRNLNYKVEKLPDNDVLNGNIAEAISKEISVNLKPHQQSNFSVDLVNDATGTQPIIAKADKSASLRPGDEIKSLKIKMIDLTADEQLQVIDLCKIYPIEIAVLRKKSSVEDMNQNKKMFDTNNFEIDVNNSKDSSDRDIVYNASRQDEIIIKGVGYSVDNKSSDKIVTPKTNPKNVQVIDVHEENLSSNLPDIKVEAIQKETPQDKNFDKSKIIKEFINQDSLERHQQNRKRSMSKEDYVYDNASFLNDVELVEEAIQKENMARAEVKVIHTISENTSKNFGKRFPLENSHLNEPICEKSTAVVPEVPSAFKYTDEDDPAGSKVGQLFPTSDEYMGTTSSFGSLTDVGKNHPSSDSDSFELIDNIDLDAKANGYPTLQIIRNFSTDLDQTDSTLIEENIYPSEIKPPTEFNQVPAVAIIKDSNKLFERNSYLKDFVIPEKKTKSNLMLENKNLEKIQNQEKLSYNKEFVIAEKNTKTKNVLENKNLGKIPNHDKPDTNYVSKCNKLSKIADLDYNNEIIPIVPEEFLVSNKPVHPIAEMLKNNRNKLLITEFQHEIIPAPEEFQFASLKKRAKIDTSASPPVKTIIEIFNNATNFEVGINHAIKTPPKDTTSKYTDNKSIEISSLESFEAIQKHDIDEEYKINIHQFSVDNTIDKNITFLNNDNNRMKGDDTNDDNEEYQLNMLDCTVNKTIEKKDIFLNNDISRKNDDSKDDNEEYHKIKPHFSVNKTQDKMNTSFNDEINHGNFDYSNVKNIFSSSDYIQENDDRNDILLSNTSQFLNNFTFNSEEPSTDNCNSLFINEYDPATIRVNLEALDRAIVRVEYQNDEKSIDENIQASVISKNMSKEIQNDVAILNILDNNTLITAIDNHKLVKKNSGRLIINQVAESENNETNIMSKMFSRIANVFISKKSKINDHEENISKDKNPEYCKLSEGVSVDGESSSRSSSNSIQIHPFNEEILPQTENQINETQNTLPSDNIRKYDNDEVNLNINNNNLQTLASINGFSSNYNDVERKEFLNDYKINNFLSLNNISNDEVLQETHVEINKLSVSIDDDNINQIETNTTSINKVSLLTDKEFLSDDANLRNKDNVNLLTDKETLSDDKDLRNEIFGDYLSYLQEYELGNHIEEDEANVVIPSPADSEEPIEEFYLGMNLNSTATINLPVITSKPRNSVLFYEIQMDSHGEISPPGTSGESKGSSQKSPGSPKSSDDEFLNDAPVNGYKHEFLNDGFQTNDQESEVANTSLELQDKYKLQINGHGVVVADKLSNNLLNQDDYLNGPINEYRASYVNGDSEDSKIGVKKHIKPNMNKPPRNIAMKYEEGNDYADYSSFANPKFSSLTK